MTQKTFPQVTWDHEGNPTFLHICENGLSFFRLTNDRWTWDQEADTVSPSIQCTKCPSHGFWVKGEWRPV